jgi:F-type H+-transporting ATPase subunit delta
VRSSIVVRRYAKALFGVGKEENALDAYNGNLSTLSELAAGQPEIMDALTNPQYPLDTRENVAVQLGKAIGAPQVMVNFLRLLVQKRRAAIIPDIAIVFQNMVDADRNISRGSVVTAVPLTEPLQKKVQATLEKITGKKVILSNLVDPSIIGGVVAKVGDLVLDGSIKSQLAGLKDTIKRER